MRNIPDDIRAEALLDYLPEGSFKLSFRGLHKRNACKDLVEMEPYSGGRQMMGLARKSLYDSLPEYMFHPVDRFDMMGGSEMREQFVEEYNRQEKEKEEAIAFFAPVDMALLSLSREVYRKTQSYLSGNCVLQNILGDRLTVKQRSNRFILKVLPFLPEAKRIRGNRTLLTLLLRKLFKDERMELDPVHENRLFLDESPRYGDRIGEVLESTFVGEGFPDTICCFQIQYWSDEECNENFTRFLEEVEQFRLFVGDWFLAVGEELVFRILDGNSSTWLSDTLTHSYLNYNTNL